MAVAEQAVVRIDCVVRDVAATIVRLAGVVRAWVPVVTLRVGLTFDGDADRCADLAGDVDHPRLQRVAIEHDRAEYMKEFLKDDSAGKAYLLKTTLNSTRDLVRTIQDVAVGRTVLDPAMVSKLTTSTNVRMGSELKGLTNRELQVLALMAKAHSNRSIAEILYIQPRTVEHHISSILSKLGFNADGEYHGRVHAVLTYLDATGQLPLKSHDLEAVTEAARESAAIGRPVSEIISAGTFHR